MIVSYQKWGAFLEKEMKYNFMEKFNITEARYRMLFSFDNIYGILHPHRFFPNAGDSRDYDLVWCDLCESSSPADVLNDIVFLIHAGKLSMKPYDVVCVKLNGFEICYRFCGSGKQRNLCVRDFCKIEGFFQVEKEAYIECMRSEGLLLSVLKGELYQLETFDLQKHRVYCIDKEVYSNKKQNRSIATSYSVYTLAGKNVVNVSPYGCPFVMISNALYYFYKSRRKDKTALLLYEKKDLELLKDYYELKHMELVL